MPFAYDEQGWPYSVTYNRTAYFYVLNLQGDVISLVDVSGAVKATYTYDAWGNAVVSSGALVNVNPLRYRGYYYDFQTQMYYLNSRYFDPANRRFISADSYLASENDILGHNMFSYCRNNPINNFDSNGRWTVSISDTIKANLFFGFSFSFGIAFDDKGTIDVQWSYAIPGVNDTTSIGLFDAGLGVSVQYTNYNSVKDLYGSSTYTGASGGVGISVGIDAMSSAPIASQTGTLEGIQATIGIGIGVDAHIIRSNTYGMLGVLEDINKFIVIPTSVATKKAIAKPAYQRSIKQAMKSVIK